MYNKINYLQDSLLLESLRNESINKYASESSFLSSLVSGVSSYVSDKMNGEITAKKVINFLSPAIIYQMFSALNFKWIGIFVGILSSAFKVDFYEILNNICNQLKSIISSQSKATSSQISSIVKSAIPNLEKTSYLKYEEIIKQARYDEASLTKLTESFKNFFNGYGNFSSKVFELLKSLFTWTFVTVFAATGFMVAGDVVNGMISKFTKPSTPSAQSTMPSSSTEDKTSFKSQMSSIFSEDNGGWTVNIKNTKDNIINLVLDYVANKYPNVNENKVVKSPVFIGVVRHILNANIGISNYNFVMIPNNFKSPDEIADLIMSSLKG